MSLIDCCSAIVPDVDVSLLNHRSLTPEDNASLLNRYSVTVPDDHDVSLFDRRSPTIHVQQQRNISSIGPAEL